MSSLISIILGFVALIGAFIWEGGHFGSLFMAPPALIVFGGTFAAVAASFPIGDVKRIPKILKVAFGNRKMELSELVVYFKEISTKTRRNGLLSLESEISANDKIDPFTKKGLQMVVDGLEPQSVRNTLELQADVMSERHKDGVAMFEAAGGYSPTMGIIGTVMGLVHVLGNLSGDPGSLGTSIAGAFIATLYGVAFANIVYLPIATKLKALDKEEMNEKQLVVEAVALIQEGVNPNVIGEKLKSFLNKEDCEEFDRKDKNAEV